ncbi:MAG TPA: ATP-binding cassette domain-containing protein [Acidothermales bacterium]|jgi:ABC-2 type transport system ATP-binding protein
MPRIVVSNLTKCYGAVAAVENVTFTLEPGTLTGFVGANGAGKSTTVRMLLGLTRPTAGTATIDGKPYAALTDPTRTVGALTDPFVFLPGRSGRSALRVLARASRIPDSRVDMMLELVDLLPYARRRVGSYSMGMRQRLGLAVALLGDPAVLILDEPANGLDPFGVHWLRGLLRTFADEGRTVLVSSHLLAELEQVADHVILIDHGRLVAQGAAADLMAHHRAASLEELYLGIVTKGSPS